MPYGTFLVCGFEGLSVPEDFARFLREKKPGGVVLFARNYESPIQLKALCSELKSFSDCPPLIMVDQEGGAVVRFREGFPELPSMRTFGERRDFAGLSAACRRTAEALSQSGVDVNLTPVVDVVTDPKNAYLKPRTFGDAPLLVSQMAKAAIEALHSGGVLTCAKHFIALGDSAKDPHQLLPQSNASKEKLDVIFFPPFRAAVEAGVDGVMSTHIRVPALDEKEPVVFSKTALSLLRVVLGFEGAILSDDLEMGGIADNWGVPEAAVLALLAGNDMALVCHSLERQEIALEKIAKEAEKKGDFARQLKVSQKRLDILRAKRKV
ncbi:MAG TPA: glycoside hydrolase family 3 N-terminal domain-containing protein [candidate division Zixibacteria bacterium]|nr:glycoside hydrolase family 3 N-terminal domain-containing protein [candidate division Zixibacteria bacterium]